MHKRFILSSLKLLFAAITLAAIATEIITLTHRGTFSPGNFLSFFTIQSNLIAAASLIVSALIGRRTRRWLDLVRGGATLYMATTGIVFAIFLSSLEASVLTAVPLDNIILHYLMPVVMVLDWLIDRPSRRISYRHSLVWLSYPLLYLIYTLIRGPIVHWYPYPFLNPTPHGYGFVAICCLVVAGVVAGGGWLVSRVSVQA